MDLCGFLWISGSWDVPPAKSTTPKRYGLLGFSTSKRKLGVVDLVWICVDFDLWFWAEKSIRLLIFSIRAHKIHPPLGVGFKTSIHPMVLGPKKIHPPWFWTQEVNPSPCFWAHIVHPPCFWAQHVHPPLVLGPNNASPR